ncbi:Scopoletin glucosyltransferase [Linum perenne]
MARLFARHGVKSTIVTTPINASLFSDKIQRDADQGLDIRTHIIEFPFAEAGLPEGCENLLWKPDCIVAGLAFHWATESAKSLGIPRLYFTGSGSFPSCVMDCIKRYEPHKSVESDLEPFGPLSLCNDTTLDKAERGDAAAAAIDGHECLSWLECREPNSVLYICFGSMSALEASMQSFIWVVKKGDKEKEEWLPEGFEKRMEGKGLIIRGWAPQVLILDHKESVAAGVPMVTWPLQSEQFINEKLWSRNERKIIVGREDIERAINQVMAVGEEAEEMRKRAMEMKEKAVKANEEGGSSYSDLKSLFEELASVRDNKD